MRISDWSSDVCSSDLYRFGYTKVEIDEPAILSPDVQPQDIFDSSTNHVAWASLGARRGDLPFGWQVSGGYERDDASQLDQRYEGKYARAAGTRTIGPTGALPGGGGQDRKHAGYGTQWTDGVELGGRRSINKK